MQISLLTLVTVLAIAITGVSISNVRGQNCSFQYHGGTNTAVYPGGTYTIYNTFTNTGSFDIQITSLSLSLDFGTYSSPSSGFPLTVPTGSSQTNNFNIAIPSDASEGEHPLTVTVGFQCLVSGNWVTPSESPGVFSSTVTISGNPSVTADILVPVVYGVMITGAVITGGIVIWIIANRRKQTPPPQSFNPPPSPSPAPSM